MLGLWQKHIERGLADGSAVLTRPDGYVAWAGNLAQPGLEALPTWFGPPNTA
ncbi:MAG: hypothetical protein ACHQHL_09505 [Steroidobacterales bacterium]